MCRHVQQSYLKPLKGDAPAWLQPFLDADSLEDAVSKSSSSSSDSPSEDDSDDGDGDADTDDDDRTPPRAIS